MACRVFRASGGSLAVCLGTLLIASASGASLAAQAENQDASRAAKLVTRWSIVMHQQFEESRATPTEETLRLLDEFMSVGAVRAIKDRATERQLKAADGNIARFIIAMAKATVRQPDGSVELDEASFTEARRVLCPLQLFCQQ
jgi:hypothetical protein